MDRILVIDTETTGFVRFKEPLSSPNQPRMVQLGFLLLEEFGTQVVQYRAIQEFDCIIKPAGWEIPDEAAAVHGITTEIAKRDGIEAWQALFALQHAALQADTVVAHNLAFDEFVIAIECELAKTANPLPALNRYCTMLLSTDVCKIPGRYGRSKWPTLQEAFQHFFHHEFDGAHGALADAKACAQVYAALHEAMVV